MIIDGIAEVICKKGSRGGDWRMIVWGVEIQETDLVWKIEGIYLFRSVVVLVFILHFPPSLPLCSLSFSLYLPL